MSEQILYGKRKICFTEVIDFTDFQGIGRDQLYRRYDSVYSVIEKYIQPEYHDFLAHPVYSIEDDQITWYVKEWRTAPRRYQDLGDDELYKYEAIKNRTIQAYKEAVGHTTGIDRQILSGAIKHIDESFLFCYDDKVVLVAWGMAVDVNKHVVKGSVMHDLVVQNMYRIRFNSGAYGALPPNMSGVITRPEGHIMSVDDLPHIQPVEGYSFVSWQPAVAGVVVDADMEFTAEYEKLPETVNVSFGLDEFMHLEGETQFRLPKGTVFPAADVPKIIVDERYIFDGWTPSLDQCLYNDTIFRPTIRLKEETPVVPVVPWYKRLWRVLRWILLALLWLLLLLFLFFLLRGCCRHRYIGGEGLNLRDSTWISTDPNVGKGGIFNPYNPYDPVPTPPEYKDILPPESGVLPPIGKDPEIIPGNPSVIGNRLNVLMENSNISIMELARAFKNMYPDDKYQVVYYDDVVKRLQIEIPSEERQHFKETLPSAFAPDFTLFVFDEALFEGPTVQLNDPDLNDADNSWYLDVINARTAWEHTMGSEEISVAIVDNGFDLRHPELKSKVASPYNVWTHSGKIFPLRVDHGTHVAGTALGIADNGVGLCGIAPNCKFIPVQVADKNNMMTTSSILDGILYSIYQGADVINVSLGMSFTGLAEFGESAQLELIRNNFKEEERVWSEISRLAALHKSTVVVAAGNDNILAGVDALHRPDNFIVVSAVDKSYSDFTKAGFSNYGEHSTVSAPGVSILSSVGRNKFASMDGTSMAAPIVTGAVALMKSLNDSLSTNQIQCVLASTGIEAAGRIGNMIQLDKALDMVANGTFTECRPVPTTGDVQILLSWDNYNDVDLLCSDPYGDMISYRNKNVPSGGRLEIDMNVEYPGSLTPIENIYWPIGGAPSGTYNVYVQLFSQRTGLTETPYQVKVIYGNKVKKYEGVLTSPRQVVKVCTFTLNGGNSNPSRGTSPGYSRGTSPGTSPDYSRGTSPDTSPGYSRGTSPGTSPDYSRGTSPGSSDRVVSPDDRRGANDNLDEDMIAELEREKQRLRSELSRVERELDRIRNSR